MNYMNLKSKLFILVLLGLTSLAAQEKSSLNCNAHSSVKNIECLASKK